MQPLVFFGSSPFSNIVLQKTIDSKYQIVAVVTTEDKPVGRGLKLTANSVKTLALKNGLTVFTDIQEYLDWAGKAGLDEAIGLVAAYGRIIGPKTLASLHGRVYNIHPSLLPKYRGSSPLQAQILAQEVETGVTIYQLDDQIDHGPIVVQVEDDIHPDDTWKTLGERLFALGTDLFLKQTDWKTTLQRDFDSSTTKKITREDGQVTWEEFSHPENLAVKLRAYADWPGVWSINLDGKRVKLISLNPTVIKEEGKP